MDENLKLSKSFGILNHEKYYEKKVSVSFDTIIYDENAEIKVLVQIEPPEVYNLTNSIIKNRKNFDLILTWRDDILEICENSKKFFFGSCWVDLNKINIEKKDEISFITSDKRFTPGHIMRHEFLKKYENVEQINGFSFKKILTPPRVENKNFLFENAKFHVVIENVSRNNWFTEKLIDCFATNTIPIYCGCPNISEIFDVNGMFRFKNLDELHEILYNLDNKCYENKLESIHKNYNTSKEYFDFHGRIESEIKEFISNKTK